MALRVSDVSYYLLGFTVAIYVSGSCAGRPPPVDRPSDRRVLGRPAGRRG